MKVQPRPSLSFCGAAMLARQKAARSPQANWSASSVRRTIALRTSCSGMFGPHARVQSNTMFALEHTLRANARRKR